MNHAGEYCMIDRRDLKRFEKDGWRLVGRHIRVGYVGMHSDNVIVKREKADDEPRAAAQDS